VTTSSRVSPRSRSSPAPVINGVKVFCATKFMQREQLGETVTQWLREHPEFDLVEAVVTQSSDAAFHCLAISVFYFDPAGRGTS
jgi:hypothetical protein